MSKRIVGTLVVAILLSACESAPVVQKGVTEERPDGTTITKSDYALALEKATEQRPLFELTCPATGCVMASLKVYNPTAPAIPQPAPEPISWATMFTQELFSTARQFAPWIGGGYVLGKAFDVANRSVTTVNNITRDSGNQTTTNTSTQTATTTTTTNTTNSNNTTRNCAGGAATGTTGAVTAGQAGC